MNKVFCTSCKAAHQEEVCPWCGKKATEGHTLKSPINKSTVIERFATAHDLAKEKLERMYKTHGFGGDVG
jgi:hypothetical protein